MRRDRGRTTLLLLFAAFSGCGPVAIVAGVSAGSGGGGGGSDGAAPAVSLSFPGVSSFTDARSVTVRGTSSDPSGVTSILVQGVLSATTDDFANWKLPLGVSPGLLVINVQSDDDRGNRNVSAAVLTLETGVLTSNPFDVDFDAARDEIEELDAGIAALFTIDPATRITQLVTGAGRGSGPPGDANLIRPIAVTLDSDQNPAVQYLLDLGPLPPATNNPRLWRVDPANGDLVKVTENATGSGPLFDTVQDVGIDRTFDFAVVVDRRGVGDAAVIAVNLATGVRELIADKTKGSGDDLENPRSIAVDGAAGFGYVPDAGQVNGSVVFEVLLRNDGGGSALRGNRTILSGKDAAGAVHGAGINFDTVEGCVLDIQGNRLLVVDSGRKALFAVAMPSGDRTILSDKTHGIGENVDGFPLEFVDPYMVALNAVGSTAFVTDRGLHGIVAVDIATGNRSLFARSIVGNGSSFVGANAIRVDLARRRAFVLDALYDPDAGGIAGRGAVIKVDLPTGDRIVVSNGAGSGSAGSGGSGPAFQHPAALALDLPRNRALVTDDQLAALFAVNLISGNRTVVSDATNGAPLFVNPVGLALDESSNRAFVVDQGSLKLLSVDLSNGDRTVVSDGTNGAQGPAFDQPTGIALDATNNQMFVLNAGADSLLSVDLTTGIRVVISDVGSAGPNFANPTDLVLDADASRLVVTDPGINRILAVNLVAGPGLGAKATLSSLTDPGTRVMTPVALELGGDPRTAIVVERASQSILLVDLTDGERVVISR